MVMMACGPYTPSESLTYDPLIDLITIINKDRPDVCILVGTASRPFLCFFFFLVQRAACYDKT